MRPEPPHLSVQCGLLHVQFARVFVDDEHVTRAFWLLTDDAVREFGIIRPRFVSVFSLDLHNKGSCRGSQQKTKRVHAGVTSCSNVR